jgi:hypothetical protein
MAVTKFAGLFLKPKTFETPNETTYDTEVWMMKMMGITASSKSLSAVNWLASLVKTRRTKSAQLLHNEQPLKPRRNGISIGRLTQARRKESHVQIGHELLVLGIEHALSGDDISGQTHTHNLHDRLEYQQDQVAQGRV